MKHKRWYDKDEALKRIMEFLENSDADRQDEVANDIIQLIVNKQYDVDNFIQVINSQTPEIRNRWYDKDETMHSAIEMLKNVDENEKKELFNEILNTFIFENE